MSSAAQLAVLAVLRSENVVVSTLWRCIRASFDDYVKL